MRPADTRDAMQFVFSEIAKSNYAVKPELPIAPSVVARPPLPMPRTATPKIPPQLPPKKEVSASRSPVSIPKLPDLKPVTQTKTNPVKLPPLPPKKC